MPTVVVFGARNLGRVLARELVAEGWNAVGVARSAETISALNAEAPDAVGVIADAVRPGDVERVFAEAGDRFGGVDLVVNAITSGPSSGSILELAEDAMTPYLTELLPAIYNVVRAGSRELAARGGGTLVQVTGGSARRGNPGRAPWAAAAFATRALTQSVAGELREQNVHVALLIVDAVIESAKTAELLGGAAAEKSTSMEDVVAAIRYLHGQTARGWTHELQLTPAGDRWVP